MAIITLFHGLTSHPSPAPTRASLTTGEKDACILSAQGDEVYLNFVIQSIPWSLSYLLLFSGLGFQDENNEE